MKLEIGLDSGESVVCTLDTEGLTLRELFESLNASNMNILFTDQGLVNLHKVEFVVEVKE